MIPERTTLPLNKSALLKRGWKKTEIDQLLGEPDHKKPARFGRTQHLYDIAHVESVECLHPDLGKRVQSITDRNDKYLLQQSKKRLQAINKICRIHPKIDREFVIQAFDEGKRLFKRTELGYLNGFATTTYWRQLGYKPHGRVEGYYLHGLKSHKVFSSMRLTELKCPLSADEIWKKWCKRYSFPAVALAEAVKFGNRLQKVKQMELFYEHKDAWIMHNQEHVTKARLTRNEFKICSKCQFSNQDSKKQCSNCEGTGKVFPKKLYEYELAIKGKIYFFHSYRVPSDIDPALGADKDKYGRPFSRNELPLPPQSVIFEVVKIGMRELLGYVCTSSSRRSGEEYW